MRVVLLGLLIIVASANSWAQEDSNADVVEPEARALLESMVAHLKDTKAFMMHAESAYEVLQDNGQMIEFGGIRRILVQKPNKARFDLDRRDGFKASMILDGENLWYVTPDEKGYGSVPQPGNLDESLDYAEVTLGLSHQLADFVGLEPYAGVSAGLTSAAIVGSEEIRGVPCTLAAYRNDIADIQLWIASSGDPVLRRLVITYRDDPGQPQFRAHVETFDETPDISADSFKFEPPADFHRLRFLVANPPDTDADLQ